MIFFKICLILTFLLLVTNISEAHLEVINKVIGEYRIELGIIPETPMAGSSTEFSVALENATSGQRFPDAEAWIRISHGDSVIFSSPSFKAKGADSVKFSYSFQKGGDYEIRVRFTTEDGKNVEADFTFQVKYESVNLENIFFFAVIGSLIFGIAIGHFLKVKLH